MKILIVDDKVANRRTGKRQLEALGHQVTVTSEYCEAIRLAKDGQFDAAILDLLMPAEGQTLGPAAIAEHLGKEDGFGYPLIMAMALAGVKRIVMATDTNHHNHPMSATVDWFHGRVIRVEDSLVLVMHIGTKDGAKDWGQALERLGAL